MNLISSFALLLQPGVEEILMEKQRLQHNYEFLSYGLIAAWIILVVYVLMMVSRQQKLKKEIASLRAMLEERH
jgi:CcmD family protein